MVPVIYAAIGVFTAKILADPYLDTAMSIVRTFRRGTEPADGDEEYYFRSLYVEKAPEETDPHESDAPETPDVPEEPTVNGKDILDPFVGDKYGALEIERIGLKVDLFYGDGTNELKYGVGQFAGSFMPGFGGPILIAGHNNTYFNALGQVVPGDIIKLHTYYGEYEYEMTDFFIANDKSEYSKGYDLTFREEGPETLTLYTCYPFYMFGLTPQRYFLHAVKISGPRIVFGEN